MNRQGNRAGADSPVKAQRDALLEQALESLERAPPLRPASPAPDPGEVPTSSPTLAGLEAIRRPQPGTVCESCPNSVWFASAVELKCYCRVMYLVTWSSNLPLVAKALHGRFPGKPVIIAGDNDQHLEATQGVNPGKAKAHEAARLTGGRVLLPIFAPGEQAADPKGYTDFNDLASKSRLGMEGLDRQVRPVVQSEIESRQANANQDALSFAREPLQRRLARSGPQ